MQTECFPSSIVPGQNKLFAAYAASHEPLSPFYSETPWSQQWMSQAATASPAQREAVATLLAEQNRSFGASEKVLSNIEQLRSGAGAVVTGQQVTLFGGPLYTLLKAATAIRKAADATAAGHPHVPIFWLASEDHDLAEADHLSLTSKHEVRTIHLETADAALRLPVGGRQLGPQIRAALDQAAELLGPSTALDLLERCYTPEATFSQAFARFISAVFADQGLIVIDASTREFHALGEPVLRHAIEHAVELNAALLERNQLLVSRGFDAQVMVKPQGSLLFLLDEETGERLSLKLRGDNIWSAGKKTYSTAELLAILASAPHRLSPNALLRPLFQDWLLPTSAYIGGPAEIAYFAQSAVLYERISGRITPVLPRLSATLIDAQSSAVMQRYGLSLPDLFAAPPAELAQRIGARSMPVEGKRKLAAAGNALDEELQSLTAWMHALDEGLGRSANVAASKMRYQMNRLRRLAANHQLERDASIRRHIDALYRSLYAGEHLQERAIGAVSFLAQFGDGLAGVLVENAAQECPGHRAIFL